MGGKPRGGHLLVGAGLTARGREKKRGSWTPEKGFLRRIWRKRMRFRPCSFP